MGVWIALIAAAVVLGLALLIAVHSSRRSSLHFRKLPFLAARHKLCGLKGTTEVALDVSNAVHQLEDAKLSIAASKEALDLAQKTMAAKRRKYELGSSTIFLVLEAQTELAAAQQALLQAEVGYQMAVAALDQATGELLEPYHVQIADLTR